jgi:hypothetical protein
VRLANAHRHSPFARFGLPETPSQPLPLVALLVSLLHPTFLSLPLSLYMPHSVTFFFPSSISQSPCLSPDLSPFQP